MSQKIKQIIFDADGTLLESENPYLSIAKSINCQSEIRQEVQKYLSGLIEYGQLIEYEEKIFISKYLEKFTRNPRVGDLERFLPTPEIKKGAEKIIRTLKNSDIEIFVLSSGFIYLIEILTSLGIDQKNIFANQITYDTKGDFVGIKVNVSGDKVEEVKKIINDRNMNIKDVVYVGDNSFDQKVIDWILSAGGKVFFLKNEQTEFSLENIPTSKEFKTIKKLTDIEQYL